MKRIVSAVGFFVLALFFFSVPARAGQYFQDFSAFTVGATNFGDGSVLSSTALGTVASVQDATHKELQLTANAGNTVVGSAFLLPDLDPGTPVNAFSVKWNADLSGTMPNAAFGFSFNFGQLGSLNLAGGSYAQEAGFGTGLSFGVDTATSGSTGFYLRVNGTNVAYVAFDDFTEWGSYSSTRHFFEADWNHLTGLTVRMDGTNIFTNVATPNFIPHSGDRFAWAARDGLYNLYYEEVRLDNIVVRTGGNLAQLATSSPYFKSSDYPPASQTADKAFDGDITTKWLTLANTGYVGATVSNTATLAAYSMTSAEDVPGRDPQTWLMDGSTDGGASWTHITSTSGYFLNRNETRAWLTTDPDSFSAFRLNILANNGDPYTQLAELRFYQFIPVPVVAKPDVATAPADQVNYTTANFNGQVAPNSLATTVWFQWGLTTNYGNVTANQNAGNGLATVPIKAAMTGLLPYTACHCQLVASNSLGTSIGGDVSFTTVPLVWAQTTAPGKAWSSIACSTNGVKFVAAIGTSEASSSDGIYLSTDSGVTWTQSGAPSGFTAWYSIASSSDGTKLVASSTYFIYVSTDSGANWTQTSASSDLSWRSVVSSADGVKLAALTYNYGGIYVSPNSGTTWTQTSASTNIGWTSIASSADGVRLYLAGYDTGIGSGVIYGSSNSGSTWTKINSDYQWSFVTCSADGVTLIATDGSGIYVSTNSGTTWTQTGAPNEPWNSIACSTDGVHLLATAGTAGIYISTDFGATWLQTGAPSGPGWSSPVSSADGTRLAAVSSYGQIWMNGLPPSVTTAPASQISYGRATLNGQITPNFVSATAWFQWGTTTDYGNSTAAQTISYSASAIPLAASITPLLPGTTYHCRFIGTNSLGITYGADATFTTLALSPTNTFNLLLPLDVINASSANSPGGQGAGSAVDGTAATKYLNFDIFNTGFTVFPFLTNVVRAVSLISAGDSPERDPASFALYGSQDGINFTLITSNSVPAFADRSAIQSFAFANTNSYLAYQIVFPTVQNPGTANSMQIAEVELLPDGEITSTNDALTLLLPAGASLNGVGPTNSILDRLLGGDADKLVVLNDTANVVALITPAAADASVVKGFELIGGDDDASFPSREPSSFTLEGSTNGINFVTLASVNPVAPTANMQIQGYSILGNTNAFITYRATFGVPQSGNVLQVGEVRLFGTPVTFPPPVLSVRATPLVYVEDDGLVAIDRTLTLSDTNATTLTGATVQITGNYRSDQDVLGFVNTPQISGNFVPATGTLTLTGTTTVANYQAALRTVTYQNTSGYPFGANGLISSGAALSTARTVTWTVTDDQPASGSSSNSITVYNVNSAPVITSAGNFAFINGNSHDINIPHYFGLSFADVDAFDNPNIDFEITITGNSLGVHDTSPELAGFPKDIPGAVVVANQIQFTTSIALANTYVANLYFQTKKAGVFAVTVTVNDNGFSGGAPPPSLATSWPQTTVQVIDFAWVTTVTGGIDVTHPGDTVQATSANSPAGQGATNAIDNTVATQYRNLDKLNTGFIITPSGTNIVRGLTLISAGDAPERNPASYLLEGSPDGTTFTTISSNTVPAFISTNSIQSFSFPNSTAYSVYRLTFPTVANPVAADSMQIAEVELLPYGEITATNDALTLLLPAGASLNGVGPTNSILDRLVGGDANKLVVLNDTTNVVALITPAAGASVVKGFELIGGDDDASFPSREPSSFTLEGSTNGINFVTLASATPQAPTANMQIQGFSILGNTNAYQQYRATFGVPQSGNVLQVGELRLFGTVAIPALTISPNGGSQVNLQWPNAPGFYLEYTTNLSSGVWISNTVPPDLNNGMNSVTNTISSTTKFFRLHKP